MKRMEFTKLETEKHYVLRSENKIVMYITINHYEEPNEQYHKRRKTKKKL